MDALLPADTADDTSSCSLQVAFKSFMKRKKMQLREQKRAEFVSQQSLRTPQEMERLRKKFLQTALAYIGVPYARKYHEPESPTHHSPLFLDCCGLVRRVLTDLKEDFGFTIGPWNQAYQFDTLPLCVSSPGDMKPGDLVFISGTYFNPRTRHQKHSMVHVEIWMGEGEKTLGARWQRGRVEIHDSYQFVSKSYHSMQYHFRSIDTWLAGVCQRSNPGQGAQLPRQASLPCHKPVDQVLPVSPVCGDDRAALLSVEGMEATLVRGALLARSWVEMEDASSTAFTLKWVETNKQINHRAFREGEQMVNHFPNISLLTTKIGLLESLRNLERLQQTAGARGPRPTSFLPETYRMDIEDERSEFMKIHSPGDIWICKPTGANQGKGIFIVREVEEVVEKLEGDKKKCGVASRPTPRIVQRYILSPLLLEGRKFDIRAYLLIISGRPYLTLFREGYIRLSCVPYDPSSSDPCVHLTNQYQQRKHPTYADRKEETVWDMARFQAYLTSDLSLPGDWMSTTLTHRMKSIMSTCFQSVKHKLNNKVGYFDLLGFDFMLDSALNLWLIEVNINPALHTSCSTLQSLVPSLVEETLDIVIEVFEKNQRGSSALPLSSATEFTLIHC